MTTIKTARKTLNRAFAEFNQADGDPEKIRQAAEKGWRAAREAVYTVLRAYGVEPGKSTWSEEKVGFFEADTLKRPRDSAHGQPLADGYGRGMRNLHGKYFYEDDLPDNTTVHGELERVQGLLETAEEDIGSAPRPIGRRHRRAA
jgi:hypothetical protein